MNTNRIDTAKPSTKSLTAAQKRALGQNLGGIRNDKFHKERSLQAKIALKIQMWNKKIITFAGLKMAKNLEEIAKQDNNGNITFKHNDYTDTPGEFFVPEGEIVLENARSKNPEVQFYAPVIRVKGRSRIHTVDGAVLNQKELAEISDEELKDMPKAKRINNTAELFVSEMSRVNNAKNFKTLNADKALRIETIENVDKVTLANGSSADKIHSVPGHRMVTVNIANAEPIGEISRAKNIKLKSSDAHTVKDFSSLVVFGNSTINEIDGARQGRKGNKANSVIIDNSFADKIENVKNLYLKGDGYAQELKGIDKLTIQQGFIVNFTSIHTEEQAKALIGQGVKEVVFEYAPA